MAQKFLTNIEVLGKAIIDGSNFTSGSTVLDVQGTQGQLFSVTNSLTGDLFAVSDISGIPILNVNSSGLITIDGNLNLGDSNKIQFGSSQDLQIYHDGSNSYISEVGTGDLIINGGNDIIFKDSVGNLLANMNESNSVELYYGGVKKFETTNTGVTITGNISATNFSGSSSGTNTGDQDLTGYLPLSAGSTKKLTDALYIQGTNTTNAESVLVRGVSSNDGDWLGSIRTANTGGYNQEMRFYTSNANGTSDEDLNLTLKPDGSARFVGNIIMAANATVDGVDISGLPTTFAPTDAEANVQADWTETTTTSDAFILNKPTIPTDHGDHDGLYLPIGGGSLTGDLLPDADSTYDIGSNASKWAEGHFDDLYVGETGNNPRIDIYTESDTANIADTFTDTTTDKSYIRFQAGTSSNDPGYIMHETSNLTNPDERNEGVLHLVPSDDNGYGDYVSIHGTNDADALKLHTNGRIETAANVQLDFLSGSGSVKISDSLDVTGSITVAGTVDGVDISALPTTFAPTNAEQNVNANWTSTSGDSQILNNPGTSYLTGVTDRHIFPGLGANSTQARKHHIGRVYYCPRHWDTTWQNLYFTINEETYNSGYIKYHLFGYYNGTDDQTLNLRVVDYRGNNNDIQRYKIVLGDHTDSGWQHSSQAVYYTDIYVEVSHYKSVKVVIDALGHSIIHSNPTAGAGITVIYETPTITNITYTNETYDTTYIGSNTKIWNSANDGALKKINGEFVLDVNDDFDTETGTWSEGTNSAWGEPNITGGYAYNDGTGSRTYDVPTGAQSCWISHLTWSSGGYIDVLGVQSDGGEVFLRRINTHQTVQNSDEGAGQHDGSTITFAGTSLSSFGKIKFQNKEGRFHFTGIAFSSSQWEGTEGTGMIHPKQITKQGSGNGLDSDKLDGQHGSYYLNYANFTGTPTIPTDFVSASNGGTFSDDIIVQGKVKAETFFSHSGTYTGNTHTNNWQKVYSHTWSTFSFSAFTLKVLAAGETANNNINADVHISYKMQNGQYRIYANIVNYGSEALLAENFQINLSVTSAASGSWTIWHKVIRNYQTPLYTMIGSGISGTWYSETPVSSITGDNDTWTEKIISNSVSIDTDNSSSVGIGTTSASSLLEVSQQLSAQSTIDYPHTISSRDDSNTINQLGGEGVGIKFKIAGNATTTPGDSLVGASIAAIRESESDSDSSTGLGLFITQNDETLDEAVRIDHDGNVGIGTIDPDYKLDVEGDISLVGSGENYAIMSPINQGMQIAVGDPASTSTPLVTFDGANQRVGIGTNNPGEKLEVAGRLYIAHQGTNWNETTPGLGIGSIHLDPAGSGANNTGNAITFGASDHSNGSVADAGIYTRSDGNYGTKMYFATTDSYAVGSKTAMYINSNKDVYFLDDIDVAGQIRIASALLSNQENTDIDTGAETVAEVSMADYTAAFFDFVIKKGTNVRAGTVYACHDGSSTPVIEFTETSTQDLGDTSDVVLSVDKTGTGGGSKMRLLATVASNDWSVKSLIRAI